MKASTVRTGFRITFYYLYQIHQNILRKDSLVNHKKLDKKLKTCFRRLRNFSMSFGGHCLTVASSATDEQSLVAAASSASFLFFRWWWYSIGLSSLSAVVVVVVVAEKVTLMFSSVCVTTSTSADSRLSGTEELYSDIRPSEKYEVYHQKSTFEERILIYLPKLKLRRISWIVEKPTRQKKAYFEIRNFGHFWTVFCNNHLPNRRCYNLSCR